MPSVLEILSSIGDNQMYVKLLVDQIRSPPASFRGLAPACQFHSGSLDGASS